MDARHGCVFICGLLLQSLETRVTGCAESALGTVEAGRERWL